MDSVPDVRYARTSDGVTIAYQVFGQGPPVVWLPSLSNLLAQWRIPAMRQAYQQLSRSMTVVLYDGRGTGSSDRRVDLADLGIDAHLRDLDAVLSEAELDSTALLGYYHSVATAIAFAAAEPRRVTRMVLFGGAARMRDAMSPAQTQALLSLVAQDWDLFADSAAQAWLGWDSGETGRLTAAAFRTAAAPATAQAWFTAAASIDVWQLARLTAPATRALAGRRFFPLWAVVHHVGRKSGRELTVPVAVRATPELFIVVLPWGPGTNWARNVLAARGCVVRWKGADHPTSRPEVVGQSHARPYYSRLEWAVTQRVFRAQSFLVLHR